MGVLWSSPETRELDALLRCKQEVQKAYVKKHTLYKDIIETIDELKKCQGTKSSESDAFVAKENMTRLGFEAMSTRQAISKLSLQLLVIEKLLESRDSWSASSSSGVMAQLAKEIEKIEGKKRDNEEDLDVAAQILLSSPSIDTAKGLRLPDSGAFEESSEKAYQFALTIGGISDAPDAKETKTMTESASSVSTSVTESQEDVSGSSKLVKPRRLEKPKSKEIITI